MWNRRQQTIPPDCSTGDYPRIWGAQNPPFCAPARVCTSPQHRTFGLDEMIAVDGTIPKGFFTPLPVQCKGDLYSMAGNKDTTAVPHVIHMLDVQT